MFTKYWGEQLIAKPLFDEWMVSPEHSLFTLSRSAIRVDAYMVLQCSHDMGTGQTGRHRPICLRSLVVTHLRCNVILGHPSWLSTGFQFAL